MLFQGSPYNTLAPRGTGNGVGKESGPTVLGHQDCKQASIPRVHHANQNNTIMITTTQLQRPHSKLSL
jgi:hypothetical protein